MLALCVVGLGFDGGWSALSSSRFVESLKVNVNLTVNPVTMKQDGEKVKDKTEELTGQVKE